MSTIRPLATIAILAGLGIFLAHQINQSPTDEGDELTANWGDAPEYNPSAVEPPPALAPPAPQIGATLGTAPAAEQASTPTLPADPAMPPLPDMPAAPVGAAPVGAAPGFAASSPAAQPAPPIVAMTPPAAGLPVAGSPVAGPPAGPVTGPMDDIPLPDDIPEANYAGLPTAPPTTQPPTAPPVADPYQSYEPYTQTPIEPDAPIADVTPEMPGPDAPGMEPGYESLGQIGGGEPSFQQSINAIDEALARGELTRAHTMLSAWYGDPGLTPDESAMVESLLSQLAGTVVYSTDHHLEPPYTVKAGDTLETIAKAHNVPWQLLAKINGVPTPNSVQAGDTLKIVRGPFNAVVNATTGELVLMVDGKYAGKFAVQLSGAAASEGQWKVQQKTDGSAGAYTAPTGKQLVLKDPSGMATLVIGGSGGSPLERGRVTVAAADLEELHDILSVGSEVIIRR
ncbi:LysM domain protein [Posidoniimonas polymericola]|uniref:LysM domain protein n=1 Tax=Posidoniimonas polymericola TaxID=2528002 RepID=A0A5C5ZHE1_9BACT|nr:LysM peptidoglycan-binding domain-containing protein [Posidoniimonas polymericola]TWT85973.1 LysM domain protein [Posidoniimonas polymericola]